METATRNSGGFVALAAAACALLTSCAATRAPPTAHDYRPAPQSTLVTDRGLTFLVAQRHESAANTTVLALQRAGEAPRPVARLVELRGGPDAHSVIQREPAPGIADRSGEALVTLEHLYAMVFSHDPVRRYCVANDQRDCRATSGGMTHAESLRVLADARAGVAVGVAAALPWRIVTMAAAPVRSDDAAVVGVRVAVGAAPLAGVAVHFNRAPHSLCVARTGADGVGTCRLEDQHGHDHAHDDEVTPVVVTFPGAAAAGGVLLPTTHVLNAP